MEIPGPFNIFSTHSCINHEFLILCDTLLIFISVFLLVHHSPTRSVQASSGSQFPRTLSITSGIFNCSLGLVYLGYGFWTLAEKLTREKTILPVDEWLVNLFQGFAWLLLGITFNLKRPLSYPILLKICLALAIFISGFLCIPSIWEIMGEKDISITTVLDVLILPGAILLLFSAVRCLRCTIGTGQDGLSFTSKRDENVEANDDSVTPFSKAGYFSKMVFLWLNPIMKKGEKKPLEEKDIPELRSKDKAQACYSVFTELLHDRKHKGTLSSPIILSTLLLWHRKELLISGICALIKVLAMCAGPLLIKAFIKVAQGEETFKYEGLALTVALFMTKTIESLSKRQWYFYMRLIGIQVRNMFSAAIYEKQLKLSSAAKITTGEIVSYVTVDAYRIGEFPYWFHQFWTTSLQLFLTLLITYYCVGGAVIATLTVMVLNVLGSFPLGKLQQKYQTKFMKEQDRMLQAITEALTTMKVLKLYAWESHFKKIIEDLRDREYRWLKVVQSLKNYYTLLFWSSPTFGPIATFGACYFLRIPLSASNVFTFLAAVVLLQEPIKSIPDVFGAFIDAKVALDRIAKLLNAPELQDSLSKGVSKDYDNEYSIFVKEAGISWDNNSVKPTLRDISLLVKPGQKVAICGEVGAGKTTLLSAILGEVPCISGAVQVQGKVGYVAQAAWIQSGTIQENILFGTAMDSSKYDDTLSRCSLFKDLEMLPFGDLTVIGERGVNLSGGQKQRIQLARALYQDADVYLLDDPFSAVDADTAAHLFNEYIIGALKGKTVLLVTHQVDFLPEFDCILLMSKGRIIRASSYHDLLSTSAEFQSLVHSHDTTGSLNLSDGLLVNKALEAVTIQTDQKEDFNVGDQLIKEEEREVGDAGLKTYLQYLKHGNSYLHFSLSIVLQSLLILGQFAQSCLLAANFQESSVGKPMVIIIYAAIGCSMIIFLFVRLKLVLRLGLNASKSIFSTLLNSFFRAPLSFYDSTPLGRILSRVSSDLSIVDLDVPIKLSITAGAFMFVYFAFGIFVVLAWEVVFIIVPAIYIITTLQRYYYASAKELTRIDGTTNSLVASHFAETAAGATTIRAFGEEKQFSSKAFHLIDRHSSAFFHSFSANEWCLLRLEMLSAIILSTSAMFMTVLPHKDSAYGFVAMALTYGLQLNTFITFSVERQCSLDNMMISVERVEQYMHIVSEAPEIVEGNRPARDWPDAGQVEICALKVRYRPNAPLVLRGITCVFEGGHKIGVVGRTGSGKTTLISTLFRLVEPAEGKIVVDGIDITSIGVNDLRSHFGVIPQEPILFHGSVRFNLDPLSEHTDKEIWEVLEKCQLKEGVQRKQQGLDFLVVQDGSNWSMGQRQLFCLGRALLKRSKLLVLDEATASIDNATDSIIQKIIRNEFELSTVITVAHRIPTVMDCTKVLALSNGELAEFDDPKKLMNEEGSLFGHLVREYWSHSTKAHQ